MNLYCKCGSPILDKDFQIDPSGTWCRICYGVSQQTLDDWELDNNTNEEDEEDE